MLNEKKTYTTYILKCSDGTYYTGYARSLEDRIRLHQEGRGAKYTRSRRPVQLAASWPFSSRSTAMKLEAAIKKCSHKEKEVLVQKKPSPKQMEEDFLKNNKIRG